MILFHLHADARGVPGPAAASLAEVARRVAHLDPGGALAAVAAALVGRPSVRIDIFLFGSALALTRARYGGWGRFYARRARAVLPGYWLGTLLVALALAGLAVFRAAWQHHPVVGELTGGAVLAGAPFRFEPFDLVRSLSIVGRFTGGRAMQVVAPSSWYIALALQLYLAFPLLVAAKRRLGPGLFVAVLLAVTTAARAALLGRPHETFWGFLPASASVELLPFRLAPVAFGMVASSLFTRLSGAPRASRARAALVAPAILLLLAASSLSEHVNAPLTAAGIAGPLVPFAFGLPGAVALTLAIAAWPAASRTMQWAGRHSLALLVVQDVLRFAVGTAVALGVRTGPLMWPAAPFYLAAAMLMAAAWHGVTRRATDRIWPPIPWAAGSADGVSRQNGRPGGSDAAA